MKDVFLVLQCIFLTYSGVIGLIIDMFCNNKVLYYCWEEHDFAQSNKWLKRQTIQLKVQISALIMGIFCGIIYIVL
jgi:hypothetical protein